MKERRQLLLAYKNEKGQALAVGTNKAKENLRCVRGRFTGHPSHGRWTSNRG